ncbi:hypothetical protein ABZ807_33285 [Micromonospora sp. NPDC047548]|uniref:hypothetical protein n=1 Tax=Micromonospora sp. NPDC047548 TaxID=3155624 RepID=UPI0033C1996A
MFVEIIGDQPLPDAVDRDDVEDLLEQAIGDEGSVTGAGTGDGRWHLDVEIDTAGREAQLPVRRLAQSLVGVAPPPKHDGRRLRSEGMISGG